MLCVGKLSKISKISYNPTFNTTLIKKSLPFAIIILLMGAYARIDSVMLERILSDGTKEAGIYAASYRILDAVNIIGVLFASLLLPMFAKSILNHQVIIELLGIASKLLLSIAISLALYVSFYSSELMQSLYPLYADSYYASILFYLMWSFCGYIYDTCLWHTSHSLR